MAKQTKLSSQAPKIQKGYFSKALRANLKKINVKSTLKKVK